MKISHKPNTTGQQIAHWNDSLDAIKIAAKNQSFNMAYYIGHNNLSTEQRLTHMRAHAKHPCGTALCWAGNLTAYLSSPKDIRRTAIVGEGESHRFYFHEARRYLHMTKRAAESCFADPNWWQVGTLRDLKLAEVEQLHVQVIDYLKGRPGLAIKINKRLIDRIAAK